MEVTGLESKSKSRKISLQYMIRMQKIDFGKCKHDIQNCDYFK